MNWVYLASAIVLEVLGTTAMKLSAGFSKPLYGVLMAICYISCFWFLTLALNRMDVGAAYAVWSGAGTVLIAAIGILLFKDSVSLLKIVSIVIIIAGIIGLNLSGGIHGESKKTEAKQQQIEQS